MKKIITFFIAVMLTFTNVGVRAENSVMAGNETYRYLLTKSKYNLKLIDNRYVTYDKLTAILDILFNKKIQYTSKDVGNVSGNALFDILENDLELSKRFIDGKDKYMGKVLVFDTFFEIMDYYFYDIIKANNLKTAYGTISKNGYDYLLTYGEGKTEYYTSYPEFDGEKKDVTVVYGDEGVIEIIPLMRDVKINMLCDKKEVTGDLFFDEEYVITLKTDKELVRYYKGSDFEILRKTNNPLTDEKITLFYGTYKKSKIAVLGLERTK